MRLLVDREQELAALRERLARPASFSLVYGQRRTGKTFLLQHLLADQDRPIYFLADETTATTQLRRFQAQVAASGHGGPAWSSVAAADWGGPLALLLQSAAAEPRRLVLVIDEVQYLLQREPALASILARLWDELHPRLALHLVLCGSALGTLARLGDAGQPLHGRFDLRLKIRAFTCRQASGFAPGWSRTDRFRLYGVFGGVARHLAEVSPESSLGQNAARAILDPLGALHEAPLDLLRVERLGSRPEADAVLEAIACGENRFNAIAARAGLAASRLDQALKDLLALEIVERLERFGDRPGSRYARYRCRDPLVAFWYRLVRPNRAALLASGPEDVWRERIEPRLPEHMGAVFERIVEQALLAGALGARVGPLDELGGYWSRDGQVQIDLVGRSAERLVFVECKWRPDGQVGAADLERLRGHAARYPVRGRKAEPLFCLATAGRFDPRLEENLPPDVVLLRPEDLLP